jgi:Zn-dependent protease
MNPLKKVFFVPLLFMSKILFLVVIMATLISIFGFLGGHGFITTFKYVMNTGAIYVFGVIGSIIASAYYYSD